MCLTFIFSFSLSFSSGQEDNERVETMLGLASSKSHTVHKRWGSCVPEPTGGSDRRGNKMKSS